MARRMQVGCLFKLQRHAPLLFRGDSGLLLISMRILKYSVVYLSMLTDDLSARADRHLDFDDTSQHFQFCIWFLILERSNYLTTERHDPYNTLRIVCTLRLHDA